MKTTYINSYQDAARENAQKSVLDFKVGDFANLICSGIKNDCSLVEQVHFTSDHQSENLCKIVEIMHVTEEQLIKGEYFPENRGGSQSDDLDENANLYSLTPEELATIYQLVTLVISDKGRYLFVDRQGYDYCRYMYFFSDFVEMFAPEIAQENENIRRRQEREEAERIEYMNTKIAAAKERFNYCDPAKSLKINLAKVISEEVGAKVKIFKRRGYRGESLHYISVDECPEKRKDIDKLLGDISSEYRFDTGQAGRDEYGYSCHYYSNAAYQVIGDLSNVYFY